MSRHQKEHNLATVATTNSAGVSTIPHPALSASQSASSTLEPIVQRAMPHITAGNYEKALSVLAAGGSTPPVQNARGVCLLRMGRYEDAVRLFRGLVLQAGGTWTRSDVPLIYKTNFATALLLHGHPCGGLSVLEEIGDRSYSPAVRLRQALAKWQATLPFLQRLNWWFGRLDPPNCQIKLDFPPGDFVDNPTEFALEGSAPMNNFPPAVEQR